MLEKELEVKGKRVDELHGPAQWLIVALVEET